MPVMISRHSGDTTFARPCDWLIQGVLADSRNAIVRGIIASYVPQASRTSMPGWCVRRRSRCRSSVASISGCSWECLHLESILRWRRRSDSREGSSVWKSGKLWQCWYASLVVSFLALCPCGRSSAPGHDLSKRFNILAEHRGMGLHLRSCVAGLCCFSGLSEVCCKRLCAVKPSVCV